MDADGNEQWQRTFGSSAAFPFDWGNAVCQTKDGGYILNGDSNVSTPLNLFVVKTDSIGNELWRRHFGDRYHDHGTAVCEAEDGGFILCGVVKSAETCTNEVRVIKTDSDGNELWTKTFGGSRSDWASSVCRTSDGAYVIAGHTNSYGAGHFDVWMFKVSDLFPQFRADPPTGHAPLEVHFSDQSAGNVISWHWILITTASLTLRRSIHIGHTMTQGYTL